jgi:uncharacterized membrane protein
MDAHEEVEHLEHRLQHRMIFFTDAVFAIVMTLLVLELRPPQSPDLDLSRLLAAMGGKLFAFALSFTILSIFWVAHMSTTRRLLRFDWPTAVANLGFLFPVCLIPFVSAWVGGAVNTSWAWGAYSLVLIATSLGNVVLVLVQNRGGGRLIAGGLTRGQLIYRLARAAAPGLAFIVGLVGAIAGEVRLTQFCSLLILPYLFVVRWTLQPPEDRPPPRAKKARLAPSA